MTTAEGCVLLAGLLPYLATLIAKGGTRYDNHLPRDWLRRQEGWRRRADAAQHNGFEAFALFAAAVVLAELRHAPADTLGLLALLFVGARLAYLACYLADFARLRSLVWFIGFASAVAIFFLSGPAGGP
jgi:uncharacterized MAPEG superfamily protein